MSDVQAICPREDVLWPVAVGENADVAIQRHVQQCRSCQRRVDALRSEIASVRDAAQQSSVYDAPSQQRTVAADGDTQHSCFAAVPEVIGKYRVVSVLDQGAQGIVCRALHPTLAKDVVIKLSKTALTDGNDDRKTLVSEGKLLANLDHPNLARVYDLEFFENRPFLVLQFVRGVNLRQHVADRKLKPREIAELLAKVARAVAAAHAAGVIHQDIKPDNIVIDEGGEPVLIDFGLARVRSAWSDVALRSGRISGTPAYMAPEQARGENDRLGPRSDVFSLGAVLYFLLTGKSPYGHGKAYSVVDRAAECEIDRTALAETSTHRTLRRICLKAMQAEPSDRYESALAFAAALERHARLGEFSRWLAGAAVILILAAAIWLATFSQRDPHGFAVSQSQVMFHVWHEGQQQSHELKELAVLVAGDQLRVEAKVPRGSHTAIFLFNSEGNLQILAPVEVSPSELCDYVHYPSQGRRAPMQGSPGTDVLFVCISRDRPIDLAAIQRFFADQPAWPQLPDGRLVEFNEDCVRSVQAPPLAVTSQQRPASELPPHSSFVRRPTPSPPVRLSTGAPVDPPNIDVELPRVTTGVLSQAGSSVAANAEALRNFLDAHCDCVHGLAFSHR